MRDGHQVDNRSAAYCQNFKQKDSKLERKEKVKKYSICVKSLKALSVVKHRNLGDCRAPNCKQCNGKHHTLLCMTQTVEQQFGTGVTEDPDGTRTFMREEKQK